MSNRLLVCRGGPLPCRVRNCNGMPRQHILRRICSATPIRGGCVTFPPQANKGLFRVYPQAAPTHVLTRR